MLTTEQNQLIDKYFSKEGLSNVEQTTFDKLCGSNSAFLIEFEFQESLQTSLFRNSTRQSAQKRIRKAKVSKVIKSVGLATIVAAIALGSYLGVQKYFSNENEILLEKFVLFSKMKKKYFRLSIAPS